MLILLIDISESPGGPDESFVEFLHVHVLNVGLLFWFQKEKVIAHTKIRAKLPICLLSTVYEPDLQNSISCEQTVSCD